jgi:hypothetical protein
METRKIEPRDGAEVYVGAKGHVCIKQVTAMDESIVILHRDDIPELIQHLQATYQEALDFVPEPEDESHDA